MSVGPFDSSSARSEHAPQTAYSRPPEEEANEEIVRKWQSAYAEACATKRKYESIAKENLDYYNGRHWKQPRPTYRSNHKSNFIKSTVETILPILTDRSPTIHFEPRGREDETAARIVEEVVRYLWDTQDLDSMMNRLCQGALVLGTHFAKVTFDPEAGPKMTFSDPTTGEPMTIPLGDVRVRDVPFTSIFPDPNATSFENAVYVIHRSELPIMTALIRYPHMKKAIAEETGETDLLKKWSDESIEGAAQEQGRSYMGYKLTEPDAPPSTTGTIYSPYLGNLRDPGKTITVLECWYVTPDGMRVCTLVGNSLESNRESPYKDGKYPFAMYRDYDRLGEFWGCGEPEELISIQKTLNKTMANITDNASLMANGIWVGEEGAFDARKVVNQPGLIVTYKAGRPAPERVPGAALPSFVTEFVGMLRDHFDTVSGVHDVTQGRGPSGITAGVAIESLQEAAHTRIRLKIRRLESFLSTVGRLMLSRIQQFYTEERIVRITNDEGAREFLRVAPENIQGEFDVRATAGASLAQTQASRFQQAILLSDRISKIDPYLAVKVALEASEYPEKEALIREIEGLKMQAQQAQAEAAQMQSAEMAAQQPQPQEAA